MAFPRRTRRDRPPPPLPDTARRFALKRRGSVAVLHSLAMEIEIAPPNPPPAPPPGLPKQWQEKVTKKLRQLMPTPHRMLTFEELYQEEVSHLGHLAPAPRAVARLPGLPPGAPGAQGAPVARVRRSEPQVRMGPAEEPAVFFTPHDHFGLALSGGGIRSATFNLGVMQALSRLRILEHVDYLATVSGGGYVGGFWTAWLRRRGDRQAGAARFPVGNDARGGERAEIRHLREFSRFLLPRIGFFQTEFWAIVMTVLGGMLPSFVAALAVLGAGWYVWITGLFALTVPGVQGRSLTALALLLTLATTEILWRHSGRSERNVRETLTYAITCVVASALVYLGLSNAALEAGVGDWAAFSRPGTALLIPGAVGSCALVLLGVRVFAARFMRASAMIPCLVGFERCVTRMIAVGVILFAVAGLWLLTSWLAGEAQHTALKWTAGGTALSAGAFAWAKRFLTRPREDNRGKGFGEFIVTWLKRATPKFLATLVWLLLLVLVGAALHLWGDAHPVLWQWRFWAPAGACAAIVFLVALLFDPARVGMHEYYRSRISRCYLGASNYAHQHAEHDRAAFNRMVAERQDDDMTLGDLREVSRPIHLVCVAANNISGDPLGNLYRGARSAVLSGHGISLGNQTAPLDHVRFSSALTASAAAFNSQMGRVSMDLGRPVAFLMSALNLRLGLWVPHPQNVFRGQYMFPGRFFLLEMLGWSTTNARNLHLSDGNHFENFGLYELVRRHCRYIIVSDCGADCDVAFDDLANVLRRVREDFGVEIEIDITPLRPSAERRATQHAVLGTIHYNGLAGMDKGAILYLKPALTGDEPPDVAQYSTRNREFPHESTGDQFYDEAQWESYRRLGEHAIDASLGFFSAPAGVNVPDRLFRDARSRWQTMTPEQGSEFLELSERCAALSHDLLQDGPARLRAEFFTEATALMPKPADAKPAETKPVEGKPAEGNLVETKPGNVKRPEGKPAAADPADNEVQIMCYLVRVSHLIEDIFVAADLDRTWSHPANEGRMNFIRRWAATPSFRRWWPVIGPLSGLGLRQFIKERFHLGFEGRSGADGAPHAQLVLDPVVPPEQFFTASFAGQQYLQTRPLPSFDHRVLLALNLKLLGYDGALSPIGLPVGFVLLQEELLDAAMPDGPWIVKWPVEELFASESLHGGGYVSKLLDLVIARYRNVDPAGRRRYAEMRVVFTGGRVQPAGAKIPLRAPRPSRAAQYERVRKIEFYKSRGFTYVNAENPQTGAITLRLLL